MSGLELNKIIAAILIASLIAMIVGVVSNILYRPNLDIAERGYQIEIEENENTISADKASEILDIEKLMVAANADAGAKIIKKCVSCHSFDKNGANKIGPNLWNIINAKKAHRSDFAYSKVMYAAGGVWDKESLFTFLHKPSKFIPGTKMSFVGIKKPEDIADVIAYLTEKAS